MSARTWYRIQNAADNPSVAEIHITDVIGSWDDDWLARNFGYDMGVTARSFIEELARLPGTVNTIHLHINSPGGDVQGGVNIANALREQQLSKGRTVETFIDGIAASIASVIAMAGSKVHIGDNALVMVHNPWGLAVGNAAEMRKTADVLDTMRAQIVATYQWHSELTDEALNALMDAETWMDADEAIANGFATDKVEGLKAAASIDPRFAGKLSVPEKFKARVDALLAPTPEPPADAPEPASALDVIRLCREAGCSDLAEGLVQAQAPLTEVQAKLAEAKESREKARAADAKRQAEEKTRADGIKAVCAKAKADALADGYIAGAMSVEAVKAHLVTITAMRHEGEIDGGLDPDAGRTSVAASWKTAFARATRHGLAH